MHSPTQLNLLTDELIKLIGYSKLGKQSGACCTHQKMQQGQMPVMSVMDHSCEPTTVLAFVNMAVVIAWLFLIWPMKQMVKQIMQMNITWLKIPTGSRQTSWLFVSVAEELNQGLLRNNSSLVVRGGLEPLTSGNQVWYCNHLAMLPPPQHPVVFQLIL